MVEPMQAMGRFEEPPEQSPYPKPKDLSHHLSVLSRNRKEANIKALYKYFAIPGAQNLAGGLPNPKLFPFDTLEADVALPSRWASISQDEEDGTFLSNAFANLWANKKNPTDLKTHTRVEKFSKPGTLPQDKLDLATALQYSSAQGYPALLQFINKFTSFVHKQIPYDHPDVIMTCGSTDSINKVMMMLLDPGDHLLVEEFAFGTALSTSRPWGTKPAPVRMDKFGLIPEQLEAVLRDWDPLQGKRPHVLYTISIGQNPTGGILPLERRREIYRICQKYDCLIVEDEPYWYLNFDTPVTKSKSDSSKGYPFLNSLSPSYISLDTDGRVIRLDTFSKTICPGSRCGWITAQPLFTERILRHSESSTQGPSGFVQAMICSLLLKFGMDGWVEWISHLRDQYEYRRNVMCDALDAGFTEDGGNIVAKQVDCFNIAIDLEKAALEKESEGYVHLSKVPLCSYVKPQGGMFLWCRIGIEHHPRYTPAKKRELMDELWVKLAEDKVIVSPGWIFASTEDIAENHCEYFRLCFAAIDPADIKAASTKFGILVRKWFAEAKSDMRS